MARTVKIAAGWAYPVDVPQTTVALYDDGAVTWRGSQIGYVWKGSRTHSPPMHKGSRIVRYHKQVPEWHGHTERPEGVRSMYHRDTRQEVIRDLIAAAMREARP